MHRITLIPGDGIGPEVASAVVRIIEASGVEIKWEEHLAGQQALDKFGTTLPDELLESRRSAKASRPSTSACARLWTFTPTCGRSARCRIFPAAILNWI